MPATGRYLQQVMSKHHMNNENIEEVYQIVCRHYAEIEGAKNALETVIKNKNKTEPEIDHLQEALRITDEIIKLLEDAGFDVENAKFEDTLKYIERWEERMKQRREEERRKMSEMN